MLFDERKNKRLTRYQDYKQLLLDEFVENKQRELDENDESDIDEVEAKDLEQLINQWSKDFERLNPDPENNSDFDSDNDINPLDTLTPGGKYTSSKSA